MEDKELLKIRIETLKTMIGRLKKEKELPTTSSKQPKRSTIQYLDKTTRKPSYSDLAVSCNQNSRYKYSKVKKQSFTEDQVFLPQPGNSSSIRPKQFSNKFKWSKNLCDKRQQTDHFQKKWSAKTTVGVRNTTVKEADHRKVPPRTLIKSQRINIATDISVRKTNPETNTWSKYKYVKKGEEIFINKKEAWNHSYLPQNTSSTRYKFVKTNAYKLQHSRRSSQMKEDSFLRKRYNVVRKTSVPTIASVNKIWILPKTRRRETFASRRLKYVQRKYVRFPSTNSQGYNSSFSKKGGSSNLSSPNKNLILSRHGTHYKVAGNLRSLRRLSADGNNLKRKSNHLRQLDNRSKYIKRSIKPLSVKRKMASQVLKRVLTHQQCKKDNQMKFCLFYNRFGKCKRGKDCKYIHDPDKIAVCTRFLRGKCKDQNCPFSHKIDPKKMPVCSYFLLGKCTNDECPYRHVNVGTTAAVCQEFLKGYCPREEKCTKKHVLYCMEFSMSGTCSFGQKCPLIHRFNMKKRKRMSSMSGARKPKAFRAKKKNVINSKSCEQKKSTLISSSLKSDSPLRNNGRSHLLPKFISSKLNVNNSDPKVNVSPSIGVMRNLFDTTRSSSTSTGLTEPTCSRDCFIPLDESSSDEEEEKNRKHTSRTFSFKEEDFIAL